MKVLVYARCAQGSPGFEVIEKEGIDKLAKKALAQGGLLGLLLIVEDEYGTTSHFEFVIEASLYPDIDMRLIEYVKQKEISIRLSISGRDNATPTKYYALDAKEMGILQ